MNRRERFIRKALDAKGCSLASIARSAKVSTSTVARHLGGGENRAVRRAVARALGVPQSKIYGVSPQASTSGGLITASHEGATTGRRLGLWGLANWGPNAAILGSLRPIRSRARELCRNDPWAKRGRDMLVTGLVGTGPMPMWNTGDPALDKALKDGFRRSTDEIDADGDSDWGGLAAIFCSEVVEAGECLSRSRMRRPSDRLFVPYQLQVLEPDHLDESLTYSLGEGRALRMGIEFDAIGRRRAYHLWREHPGDVIPMSGTGGLGDRVVVPAQDIQHGFNRERAGQVRGLPWLSPVILRLYDMAGWDDATLVRTKMAAMYTGTLFPDAGGGAKEWPGVDGGTAPSGQQVMDWEPGMMGTAPQGYGKIEWSDPPDPGAQFDQFMNHQMRGVAAGMGPLLSEQVSGNLENVNLSTMRVGLNEMRQLAELLTWKIIIRQFCRPHAIRWLEAAVLSGAIPIRDYFDRPARYHDIYWLTPKKPYMDPLKDWAADVMSIRALLRAPQDVILERGDDPDEILRRHKEWNDKLAALGLVSDANPLQTSQSGGVQAGDILRGDLAAGAAGR